MRGRAYRRERRRASIRRKKAICRTVYGNRSWYRHDGQYSKGKIHCSCWMCRESDERGRHILTRSEILAIRKMREETEE